MYFSGNGWYSALKHEGVERVLYTFADVKYNPDFDFDFPDVMLDSGAFSMATGKAYITIQSYTLWLEIYLKNHPQIKIYAALDDIKSARNSMNNYKYMIDKGLNPLPCYHYGEQESYLEEYCKITDFIALGGLATSNVDTTKIRKWWERIHNMYPEHKFHVFAIGNPLPFIRYQPFSVDSTSWLTAVQYGTLLCYKNGIPSSTTDLTQSNGYTLFFKREELLYNNIRVMLDWEKMEWVENARKLDFEQPYLM